jgi:hypothetical protein
MVSPLMQRSSPMPPARSVIPASFNYAWRGQRPRWLSVAIAVLLCIAASGSGAFVVRALKIRKQPLLLQPTQINTSPSATSTALPRATAQAPLPAATNSTTVVDLDSLSVERRAPRAVARIAPPPVAAPAPPAAALLRPDNSSDTSEADDNAEPAPAPQPTAKKVKASDLPAAAHSNPYTTGAADEAPAKKPAPPSDDAPGL